MLGATVSPTESATALAQQLLARYGVLTREVAAAENISGGFSAVYDVLKALEDAGRIRRGYFASGVGATQFALPAALDLLRSLKDTPEEPEVVVLAATDPANPYGTILRWPERLERAADDVPEAASRDGCRAEARTEGARRLATRRLVARRHGQRRARGLHQPRRAPAARVPPRGRTGAIDARRARWLAHARRGESGSLLIARDQRPPGIEHPLAPYLVEAGFSPSAMGFQIRQPARARGVEPSQWHVTRKVALDGFRQR